MKDQGRIAVFGATGKVGKELIDQLSRAGMPAIAVTRDKAKAKPVEGIEWMEADMTDLGSVEQVMRESRTVFLASSVGPRFAEEQGNVIDAAVKHGITHLVKLSSPGADKDSGNFIARPNGVVEDHLKRSGIAYTILQPNTFMQNWIGHFSDTVKRERRIYEATGDGKKPFLDTRDIAACALAILAQPEAHRDRTYLLTGGVAVSYGEVADAIGEAIGEKVTYVSMTSEQARERMGKFGMPEMMINTFIAIAEGQRSGKANYVNTQVEELLGRKPIDIHTFARDHARFFQ